MADGLRKVAALPDPVGEVVDGWVRPNGLRVERVRVPLGVVGIIYENRPNVTSDAAGPVPQVGQRRAAAGLVLGHRLQHGRRRRCCGTGWPRPGCPADAVVLVEDTSRAVGRRLHAARRVHRLPHPPGRARRWWPRCASTPPCPTCIDGAATATSTWTQAADLAMAESIVVNAKTQRPGVCNSAETLLVHRAVADGVPAPAGPGPGRGDPGGRRPAPGRSLPGVGEATEEDFATEFLGLTLSVAVVDDLDGAIDHIARFGSGHSEAIVTGDLAAADRFTTEVDAAAVLVNASTRFIDGEELGLGAEIGISTQKLHARGPMGLRELTSVKYVVTGTGQVRS